MQGNSFQNLPINITGVYLLKALGAQGGVAITDCGTVYPGGFGTLMQGQFYLSAGDKLTIAVGGKGGDADAPERCGGGGGSTSIVSEKLGILLVAGGGGGAANVDCTREYVLVKGGFNATIEQNGVDGDAGASGGCPNGGGGLGGVGGVGGGIQNSQYGGAGGAGYYGDGGTHCGKCDGGKGIDPESCDGSYNVISYGGQALLSGNYGGCCNTAATCNICPSCGGFGGGGQSGATGSKDQVCGGGGGGGYSGGGGGGGGFLAGNGGGGGSINTSSLHKNDTVATDSDYDETGNGYASIQFWSSS